MKLIALIYITVMFLPFTQTVAGQTNSPIVKIDTTYNRPDQFRPWQMLGQQSRAGSGCIIAGNRILTNAHVVSDAMFIKVRRAGRPDQYNARTIHVSHPLDLAILTVDDPSFFEGADSLTLGDLPEVGNTVKAFGFPSEGTRLAVTEGVISSIERMPYSHAGFTNIVYKIDAAINAGSSGGPVLLDGQIVGVSFQVGSGENVGYAIPASVIKHYLDDLLDGQYDGTPYLGVILQSLKNDHHRRSLGLPKGRSGILIIEPLPGFEGEELFLAGDVILAVDGNKVANDGTISWRGGQRIGFRHAVDVKHIGNTLSVQVFRNGKTIELDIPLLLSKHTQSDPVPRITYENTPSYVIIGGIVFGTLTTDYLAQWGKWNNIPIDLRYHHSSIRRIKNQNRKQIIIIIDVLTDDVNHGYEGLEDSIVAAVNGTVVNSMREFVEAIDANDQPHLIITLDPYGAKIVFEREDLSRLNAAILQKYGITEERSLDYR